MTTDAIFNFIEKSKCYATFSTNFQTASLDTNAFKNNYNLSAYSYKFHRCIRWVVAVPTAVLQVIKAIFINILIEAYYESRSSIGSISIRLNYHRWVFISKCDLYIAWGHLSTIWSPQAGLERIHRGELEKWKNSWEADPLILKDSIMKLVPRIAIRTEESKGNALFQMLKYNKGYSNVDSINEVLKNKNLVIEIFAKKFCIDHSFNNGFAENLADGLRILKNQ